MTLQELLETVETGKLMKFSLGHGKNGRVVIASSDVNEDESKNERYVIDASIKNFSRFESWPDKQKRADIQKTGKFYRTKEYGKLPLIQIRIKDESEDMEIDNDTPDVKSGKIIY